METEHEVELILRFRTNMGQGELDDLLSAASEDLFRSEGATDGIYAVYEPVGSHWRDVTPYPGTSEPWSRGLIRDNGWDPSAVSLPGGNRLGPGQPRVSE